MTAPTDHRVPLPMIPASTEAVNAPEPSEVAVSLGKRTREAAGLAGAGESAEVLALRRVRWTAG